MKSFLLWLIALVFLASPAYADHFPEDHITARAWFEDRTGQMGLSEAVEQEFQPYQGVLARGFGKSAVWVRLSIDPQSKNLARGEQAPLRLILRIRPVYLDNVELFDPAHSTTAQRITGDRWPSDSDEFRTVNLGFAISTAQGPRDIYLRITSTSTRLFVAELLSSEGLYYVDSWLFGLYGLALGISVLLLAWGLIAWLVSSDRLTGIFVLSQSAAVILAFLVLGFARYWFSNLVSPTVIDSALSLFVMLTVFLAVWYYVELWRDYDPPPKALWLLKICLFALPIQLLMFFLGHRELAMQLNWLLVLYASAPNLLLAFVSRGWRAPREGNQLLLPRKWLLLYFGLHLGFLALSSLAALGVLGDKGIAIYLVLVHALLNGVLAVVLLQHRLTLIRQHRDTLEFRLALAEEQVLREREFRRDRDGLFSMLAHELKTAMSTISLSVGTRRGEYPLRRQVRESLVDMSEVIDKTLEMARFDDAKVQINRVAFDAVEEIQILIERYLPPESAVFEAPPECEISCDLEVFRTIVGNLFSNAAKYREPQSKVQVRLVNPADGGVRIDVMNTPGRAGLPDPQLVFEKYYRNPLAKGFTGSGLGLYLVKGLCGILGGTVSHSNVQNRVCFSVWLPS